MESVDVFPFTPSKSELIAKTGHELQILNAPPQKTFDFPESLCTNEGCGIYLKAGVWELAEFSPASLQKIRLLKRICSCSQH